LGRPNDVASGKKTSGAKKRLTVLFEVFVQMIDAILRDLRQPEYIHVLINPLPVYGLAMGLLGLIVALFSKSRRAQIVTLIIVVIAAASAWPVYEFGEQAYNRVLTMADEPGQAWLDEHKDRGEDLIWFFYTLAVLSAIALFAPRIWPPSATPLVIAVILLGIVTLGCGGYIAYTGGKIRHREFRNVPPPPGRSESER
jgi:dolichol kinase